MVNQPGARLVMRLEPQFAAIVDSDLFAGSDIGDRDQVERMPGKIAVDPGARTARMVAQADQAQTQCAAPFAIGVPVPVKVIVVEDRPVQEATFRRRYNDYRRCL